MVKTVGPVGGSTIKTKRQCSADSAMLAHSRFHIRHQSFLILGLVWFNKLNKLQQNYMIHTYQQEHARTKQEYHDNHIIHEPKFSVSCVTFFILF